jgi:hypothetical protein
MLRSGQVISLCSTGVECSAKATIDSIRQGRAGAVHKRVREAHFRPVHSSIPGAFEDSQHIVIAWVQQNALNNRLSECYYGG